MKTSFKAYLIVLLQSMEARNQSVDNLLLEIDQSIAASRHTMRQLDGGSGEIMAETNWDQVQLQAVQRCVTDCPICIMPLSDQGLYKKNSHHVPQFCCRVHTCFMPHVLRHSKNSPWTNAACVPSVGHSTSRRRCSKTL
ncbi:RING finger protein 32 [Desmophyllum pertusum]|uniref:RING finger protein 32 n=1 Tax=Desmophyllum pertusum TaxID=174260 RepID=A0A9W9Y7R1_9CNID|nr:RING finger protein 32 [Desmophyllum pertusum]